MQQPTFRKRQNSTAFHVDRRGFLGGLSGLVAASLLPGCGPDDDPIADTPIDRFLHVSSLLTGFEDLLVVHGQIYLDSFLAAPDQAQALDDLYKKAGYGGSSRPQSLQDLEARGIFADDRLRAVADAIILCWYTGVYESSAGPKVATYTEALTWRALDYTNRPNECGGLPGFWSEPPAG